MRGILILVVATVAVLGTPRAASAVCHLEYPDPANRPYYNPTGWQDCTSYGVGKASRYPGPGVARNDCLWPWTDCTTLRITSLLTSRSIIVRPVMFCDCWQRRAKVKLVDLDPAALNRLGLDWDDGVYDVRVEVATPGPRAHRSATTSTLLPDTAMGSPGG